MTQSVCASAYTYLGLPIVRELTLYIDALV